jgi:uncharacterized protein
MNSNSLPPVIQAMLSSDFYPHPVQEPIELIQTHISYVLLTGDYVYKLKKPVNFGFLNFSTLELREHFCHEELRLNQRGAAPLYREVLAITKNGDRYELNGSSEVVEYAIKMVQFPQENLFITLFENGKITTKEMESLGKVVAELHQQTTTNDYIRSFGEIPKIRQSIDENYEQTSKYVGTVQTSEQLAATRSYTDNFFAGRQEIFKKRVDQDKIRECHGDLHLRNICFYQDQILLFDCIEFNEPFRFVDVMYDIGFAVMDLEARGRKDLANAFLNTYIEQTGDWEGLQVLPLYLSRQAYVRAKVTSFLLDDPNIPENDKEQAAKTASHYYKLAWEYTQPKQGKLTLMSGLSGSGKSTTGRKIAQETSAIHLRSDAVRKHLGGVKLTEKGEQSLYSPEMTKKTYSRLLELGIMLIKQGFNVILDAKYDRVSLRSEVLNTAQKQQIPVEIVYCTTSEEILRDRLQKRTGDIADAGADLLQSQIDQWEDFTDSEKQYLQVIDTSKN